MFSVRRKTVERDKERRGGRVFQAIRFAYGTGYGSPGETRIVVYSGLCPENSRKLWLMEALDGRW
jgi:hypothetical protein